MDTVALRAQILWGKIVESGWRTEHGDGPLLQTTVAIVRQFLLAY